jgi:hypothetical protein
MPPQNHNVSVKYQLTASCVFVTLVRQAVRRMAFLRVVLVLSAVGLVAAIVEPNPVTDTVERGALVMFMAGAVCFLGLPLMQTAMSMRGPHFGRPMVLTVSGAGLEFSGEETEGLVEWKMVAGVSETRGALAIRVKAGGVHIVPKRHLGADELVALRQAMRASANR